LYYLSYPACELRRITNDLLTYGNYGLGITSDSTALTADIWESSAQIWTIGADGDTGGANRLSLGNDDGAHGIAPLPDGRIAYVARTGDEYDIWIAKEDGTGAKPLTADSFSQGEMSATPDGRYLVFTSDRAGGSHLFRIEMDGSNFQQLTFGDAHDAAPDCSPDGNWVAYASTSDGMTTLWKVPVEGGSPVQLTDYESVSPAFSPDAKLISCILPADGKLKQGSIAVVTAEGGAPVNRFGVLPYAFFYRSARWTPDGQALVFTKTENHVINLWQQPLKGGSPLRLTNFKADSIFNFTYSRDGKRIILSRGRVVVNVVLIKDFT
jgi:Tol biopolymer transport system component